ncbi:MAG TPA: DUF6048 family protein [Ohtaekwangia sp.]
MRSLINISLLIVLTLSAQAQEAEKVDTTVASKKYLPTGLRLGVDALSLARNFYDDSFTGWEVNADVDFYRYHLAVDYGYWGRDYNDNGNVYANDGTYMRVGADVNFLMKDPDRNMFFIGARYGRGVFSEDLTIETVDPIWGEVTSTLSNNNVTASWYELTTGIRVKMWKMIWMGYTARFKFGLNTNETGDLIPSDVPGYGGTDKESTWGFNYQIFVRIPVRKAPSGPLKVSKSSKK